MREKQSVTSSLPSMERWHGAKNQWSCGESRGIEVNTEKLVNTSKTCWRSIHGVIGWLKPVLALIPYSRLDFVNMRLFGRTYKGVRMEKQFELQPR